MLQLHPKIKADVQDRPPQTVLLIWELTWFEFYRLTVNGDLWQIQV
jgi:hypothetical protein